MLKLLKAKDVHDGLVSPLQQFHVASWTVLDSYIHAGLHPLGRQSDGFPEVLACQLLRGSHALFHATVRVMAVLTWSASAMAAVTELWNAHRSCLPITPGA